MEIKFPTTELLNASRSHSELEIPPSLSNADSLSYHSSESVHFDQSSVYNDDDIELYERAMKCLCLECDKCLQAMKLQRYPLPIQEELDFITSYDENEEWSNIYNYNKHQNEMIHPEPLLNLLKKIPLNPRRNVRKYRLIYRVSFFTSLFFVISAIIMIILSEHYRLENKTCLQNDNCDSEIQMINSLLIFSSVLLGFFLISISIRLWSSRLV